MDALIIQIWGGVFYTLSKLFLALGEGDNIRAKRIGWVTYLAGAPAMIYLLYQGENYPFTAVEIIGTLLMVYGLVLSFPDISDKRRARYDRIANVLAAVAALIALVAVGNAYGMGNHSADPVLQVLGSFGFIFGLVLIARGGRKGWYWFALMNVATGLLFWEDGYYLLTAQQLLVSLGFVIWGLERAALKDGFKRGETAVYQEEALRRMVSRW